MRIVSLLPSATEIISSMGLGSCLVGRSHECDFPPEVLRLPACTAREIPIAESTPGIQLRAAQPDHRALSVFLVDWGLLRGLNPTHIVTQTLCEYCAVSEVQLRQVLAAEFDHPPELIAFKAQSLPGVIDEIRELGAQLGHPANGASLADSMSSRIQQLADSLPAVPKPTVACMEWLEPVMLGGNWIPEMIRLAGGVPVGGGDGEHSSWIAWDRVLAADPDIMVVMPCGYPLARIESEMHWLAEKPRWNELKAVRTGNVFLADGSALFNRPGPRLVESLKVLIEVLHPSLHSSAHEGLFWKRWAAAET